MMKASVLLIWLLFSCFLFALPNSSDANQADQLQKLIKSKESPKAHRDDLSATFIDGSEASSPIYLSPQDGLKEGDKIGALPGQPQGVKFDQYAGYVTVDPKAGRNLFYYFIESPQDPSKKPLVLWLNGGPGCSSLGYGAMEELGPFAVNSDGKTLRVNPYAWNNVANVIFLESPAGVGFSYSKRTPDYELSGDKRTAEDSYTFLLNWLERFPQYKMRNFFITGESYAGHYVPQLADLILHNNKNASHSSINLKAIAIGNALVDDHMNFLGKFDFMWSHTLYSDQTHSLIVKNCDISKPSPSLECIEAFMTAQEEVGEIDYYNIYAPSCHETKTANSSSRSINGEFDTCTSDYVHSYLNLPEVQKAFHAVPTSWQACKDLPWNDRTDTTLPIIKKLTASGIFVWMYSGDIDAVVPVTDTKYSINLLGLPIRSPWRPWYSNSEVGGYVVAYKGLTFATVRGAGHEVPSYQPERSLILISAFLQGKLP